MKVEPIGMDGKEKSALDGGDLGQDNEMSWRRPSRAPAARRPPAERAPPTPMEDKPVPGSEKPPPQGGAQTAPPWKTLFYDYTQNASLHGVRFITEQSRFIVRKVIWFAFVAASLSFLTYYTYNRVAYYLEYNKNVNVEVNYLQKVKFPAVTFCNQNAFRITSLADNGWYYMIKDLFTSSSSSANRKCISEEFQCGNGECLDSSKRCDIFPDCADQTDELDCDPCPLLLFDGDKQYREMHPSVVGQTYMRQPDTYNTITPVYLQSNTSDVYLYYDTDRWKFSSEYMGGTTFAYVIDAADALQNITTTTWMIDDGGSFVAAENLTAECTLKYSELLYEPDSSVIGGLTLSQLYDTASHKKDEFIQQCLWKGLPCAASDIQTRLTDMGVCYTFISDDMYVEQSGPGYGLSLTVNIEQYEYTKSTQDGIGLKLLMHEPEDVPMMTERGTSVSPGLYSFIAVETTEVQNLAPPWGSCGSSYLKYYNSYSIAQCTLECETDFVSKRCGCRDLHMPHINGDPPICEVADYVDCESPAIDLLRAAGNYCTCATPCVTAEYVPTTSFSIVLGPDTGSNVQDERTFSLQQKLFKARETTYRVVQAKYLNTMRYMHLMDYQMGIMIRFLVASDGILDKEHDDVLLHTAQVYGDCMWVRTMMENAKTTIRKDIKGPLETYKGILESRARTARDELEYVIKEGIDAVNAYHGNHSAGGGTPATDATWEAWMAGILAKKNDTAWNIYSNLEATLIQLRGDLYNNLQNDIGGMSVDSDFRLHKTRFDPLVDYVGDHCSWCIVSANTPIMQIVKSRVQSLVGSSLYWDIYTARSKINQAYTKYIKDLLVANETITISGTAYWQYYGFINSAESELDSAISRLNTALHDTEECLEMIEDLLHFTWELRCRTELTKLVQEYEGSDMVSTSLLAEMESYLQGHQTSIVNLWDSYKSDNTSLERVGSQIQFSSIDSTIADKKLRLDSTLNERWLSLQHIHGQINSIGYAFMALVDDSHLASTSAYWQAFGITSPVANIPGTTSVLGNPLLLPGFSMQPNTQAEDTWAEMLENVEHIRENLQTQGDDLSEVLLESKTYFTVYIEGNQLGDDFYSNNFLQVELFYKELTERKVSQQKAYEYQNLLSEIGGFMGLLMGASVLSICEVLDLFIYNTFRKVTAKTDPKPNKVKDAWG